VNCGNQRSRATPGSRMQFDPAYGEPVPQVPLSTSVETRNAAIREMRHEFHHASPVAPCSSAALGAAAGSGAPSARHTCRTPGCNTPHLKVRPSTSLCFNCTNREARAAPGRIEYDPSGRALDRSLLEPDIVSRNTAAHRIVASDPDADEHGSRYGQAAGESQGGAAPSPEKQKRWPFVDFEDKSDAVLVAQRRALPPPPPQHHEPFRADPTRGRMSFFIPPPPEETAALVPRQFNVPRPERPGAAGGVWPKRVGYRLDRPAGAPMPMVPTRDGVLSGHSGTKVHIPSIQGPLSGRKVDPRTFVPSREGVSVAARLEELRVAREKQTQRLVMGWASGTGRALTEAERAAVQSDAIADAEARDAAKKKDAEDRKAEKVSVCCPPRRSPALRPLLVRD